VRVCVYVCRIVFSIALDVAVILSKRSESCFQLRFNSARSSTYSIRRRHERLQYFSYYESIRSVMALLDLFPENVFILSHVALYLLRLRYFQMAEPLFVGALVLDPEYDVALWGYARLLVHKGEFRAAQRYLSRLGDRSSGGIFGPLAKLEGSSIFLFVVYLFLVFSRLLFLYPFP
jgi:tetratricopeptide (TPR) repeat protein